MLLRLIDEIDIGHQSKQRLLFLVINEGNLLGNYLLMNKDVFYMFPYKPVKKGDYVVLYISPGNNETKVIVKQVCHFLYVGKWVHLWEDQKEVFKLAFG